LPGFDGRDLLQRVRARDPKRTVPIIVLSTSSHPKDIDTCYRAGADAYMVKPLELEDWESKVGSLAQSWLRRDDSAASHAGQSQGFFAGDDAFAAINRIVEGEIIPRLLLLHSGSAMRDDLAQIMTPDAFVVSEDEVAELTRLLLTQDVAVASAYVEAIRSQGATLGSLYLSLLAPAAQLVGNWWRNDQCGFNEVLFVLSRLQQLLREFTPPADAQKTH
jgi:CheY-like chemotaxis protein